MPTPVLPEPTGAPSPSAARFSSRSDISAEGAYAMMARAKALEAKGRRVIHLEIGEPDGATPAPVVAAGIQAIEDGHTRYTPAAGRLELRAAIAEHAGSRRGVRFTPEQVVVGPGAKPPMLFATLALIEPGDEMIIPDPGYPAYAAIARMAGAVIVPVRLAPDGLYGYDLDDLERKISPRTRLIVLNSPANPTGGITPLPVLERIAAAAQRADAWLISDEVYREIVYEGDAPSIATLPGMAERTILIDSFSKTYCMTGWRLGYGIMPPSLARRVEAMSSHGFGGSADFTQWAALAALRGDQAPLAAMRESLRQRRDLVVRALNAMPGVRCPTPRGAFYAFPDIRGTGRSSREITEYLLEEAGVAVLSGTSFGPRGEGYVRLSYATALDELELAMERIAAALHRYAT